MTCSGPPAMLAHSGLLYQVFFQELHLPNGNLPLQRKFGPGLVDWVIRESSEMSSKQAERAESRNVAVTPGHSLMLEDLTKHS